MPYEVRFILTTDVVMVRGQFSTDGCSTAISGKVILIMCRDPDRIL